MASLQSNYSRVNSQVSPQATAEDASSVSRLPSSGSGSATATASSPSSSEARSRTSRPQDPAGDDHLENDLLQLMGQMEGLLERLASDKKVTRLLGGLQTSRELIRQVFVFADGRLRPESQTRAFERCQNVYDAAGAIDDRIRKLSKREIESFFSDSAPQAGSPRADYRRFGLALRSALEGYFALFVEGFTNPNKVRQWSITFRVFLDDLTRRWW